MSDDTSHVDVRPAGLVSPREDNVGAIVGDVVVDDLVSVTETDTLADGESLVVETEGRPAITLQYRGITTTGSLELETSADGEDWWGGPTFEDLSEAGFQEIPWVTSRYVRVSSVGFEGEVRITGGR